MHMYNLIEYSENYGDSSESLYQFKRDEQKINTDGNLANIPTAGSSSFKLKSSLLGNPVATIALENAKIFVPLKYLFNFLRSFEMPLINCKIHLELSWSKDCVISTVADTTFKKTSTKLYVPIALRCKTKNRNDAMFAKFSQKFLGLICGQTKQSGSSETAVKEGSTKHCCWGNCKNDSRYPDKLPSGTYFIIFPKPGKVKESMNQWEKEREYVKAKKWVRACAREGFSIKNILKRHFYLLQSFYWRLWSN